ncbi:MAG: hypothetical protein GY845_25415 [Planctomycetes bacterium]|nr:hypothetical protein [Planctomycetota bacterium]
MVVFSTMAFCFAAKEHLPAIESWYENLSFEISLNHWGGSNWPNLDLTERVVVREALSLSALRSARIQAPVEA